MKILFIFSDQKNTKCSQLIMKEGGIVTRTLITINQNNIRKNQVNIFITECVTYCSLSCIAYVVECICCTIIKYVIVHVFLLVSIIVSVIIIYFLLWLILSILIVRIKFHIMDCLDGFGTSTLSYLFVTSVTSKNISSTTGGCILILTVIGTIPLVQNMINIGSIVQ